MPRQKASTRMKLLDVWPEQAARAYGLKSALLEIPRVFSLIENPGESLETLILFRRILEIRSLRKITIDYKACEKLDLCASVVLDVLAMRGKRQHAFRHGKLGIAGNFSGRPEIDIMLVSSGILKHLGSPVWKRLPPKLLERLRFSELTIGRPSPPSVTSDTELAATALTEFFDQCLRTEKYQLKEMWKSNLIQLVTEVLDNAEEHGSGERIWHTIGYYNKSDDEAQGGECHIVMFNFGESIYESLNRADTSPELKRQIQDLAREHESEATSPF